MNIGAPSSFFRAAAIYGVIGLALGIHMAASQDHGQLVTHAHIMLIGWVTTFLYGAYLKLHPAAGQLPAILWGVANLGLVLTATGLYILYGGQPASGEPIATAGAFIVFGGMILFTVMVWRTRS